MNEKILKEMIHKSIEKLYVDLNEVTQINTLTKVLALLSEAVFLSCLEKNEKEN